MVIKQLGYLENHEESEPAGLCERDMRTAGLYT